MTARMGCNQLTSPAMVAARSWEHCLLSRALGGWGDKGIICHVFARGRCISTGQLQRQLIALDSAVGTNRVGGPSIRANEHRVHITSCAMNFY